MKKNLLLLSLICCFFPFNQALSPTHRAQGFVYLEEVDPTIITSLRYTTSENFVGAPLDGYTKSRTVLTKQAALALKAVQAHIKKDGYSLVVYDAYRPQQASNHFVRWADAGNEQLKKGYYYPRVDKAGIFELGYVGPRSSHSRGSTIDLTLIEDGKAVHAIRPFKRTLRDGSVITVLDDGTLDMGSSFDLFDVASHFENNLIEEPFKKRRAYLKMIMEKHGFKPYEKEWWHFTLRDEPYPADKDESYFNFVIE